MKKKTNSNTKKRQRKTIDVVDLFEVGQHQLNHWFFEIEKKKNNKSALIQLFGAAQSTICFLGQIALLAGGTDEQLDHFDAVINVKVNELNIKKSMYLANAEVGDNK